MAEKIFDAQSNYGWGLSLNMTGKAPAIAKRIWNTYNDALAYVNNFNDSAIEGLQLSVVADIDPKKNGVYFVVKAGTFLEADGVKTAKNDGVLVKVGGAETEAATKYSEAVTLSQNLVVGQLIKVSSEEIINDQTYKAGFYIVNAPGSISALDTSTGASDEIGALSNRVTALEGDRVKTSDFETYKSGVASTLDSKAAATDLSSHTGNTTIHVTAEEKTAWNNTLDNAKQYTTDEIAKLSTVYDAKGAADTALTDAKKYTDDTITGLDLANTYDAKGAADTALTDAKKYTDDTITGLDLANTYDAKGAANTAEQNAKAHADGLNTAMDTRVKATEDAIVVLNGDASTVGSVAKAVNDAINAFAEKVTDNDVVDTFKELVDYAAANGAQVGTLIADVAKKADTTYVDGLNTAMDTRVKANEDAIAVIKGTADTEGSIAKAKADAIAAAEAKIKELEDSLASKYDAIGAADTALTDAKKYTDDTITDLDLANTYEAKGTAANLDAALKTTLEAYADQAEADAIATANAYADQAEADAITASNTYAKTYTDLLFDSFKFAGTTDIDTIFNKVQPEPES